MTNIAGVTSVAENVSDLIGGTRHIRLKKFAPKGNIIAKIESGNPGFCVKERIAKSMIEDAESTGKLSPGGTIVEPTSGNTGIGLALVGASKGYAVILTMPDTMSIERRKMLKYFGADIVLTPGAKGMKGAIEKATEISIDTGAFMPQQFENPANPKIHEETTGPEIWEATKGKIDFFVAGVGTGGTITGVGRFLKSKKSDAKIIAVEPSDSPVLSGGSPAPHKIQGIGAGFIPPILDTDLLDEIHQVTSQEAVDAARELAKTEGIAAGISCGAALATAKRVANENPDANVIVILPDTGERYLSTILFEGIEV